MRTIAILVLLLLLVGCRDDAEKKREDIDALIRELHDAEDADHRASAATRLKLMLLSGKDPRRGEGPVVPTTEEQRAIEALTRALGRESSSRVRESIVWALQAFRPPGRQPVLIACARDDMETAGLCVDALLVVANVEDLRELVGMLGTDAPGAGRIAAGLQDVGDRVLPELACLVERAGTGAQEALHVLSRMESRDANEIIATALRSPVERLRFWAMECLRLAQAVEPFRSQIEPLLADPCSGVRQKAAKTLGVSIPTPPSPSEGPGCGNVKVPPTPDEDRRCRWGTEI